MKSERRQELQTNSLARFIYATLPAFWDRHGTKLLILVIIGAVSYYFYRRHENTKAEEQNTARQVLAEAQAQYDNFRMYVNGAGFISDPDPVRLILFRDQVYSSVKTSITEVQVKSSEDVVLAQALLLKGDLNYTLARLPAPPGAATRPSLAGPVSPAEALKTAEEAYTEITTRYSKQRFAAAAARLGLGAVAVETRRWDQAAAAYKAVSDDAGAPDPLRKLATDALARLDSLKVIPELNTPSTLPSILAAPSGEVGLPPASTRPSTDPVERVTPTTRPAVGPASLPSNAVESPAPASRPTTR